MIGWFLVSGNEGEGEISNDAVNAAYRVITMIVFGITILASIVFHFGTYEKPKGEKFLYFTFHKLWKKMLQLAVLKGLAQGFIVTAPAMLMMKFFPVIFLTTFRQTSMIFQNNHSSLLLGGSSNDFQ